MSKEDLSVDVLVKHQISVEQIRGLLCCALEGGVNYWADYKVGFSPSEKDLDDEPGGVWKGLHHYWIEHPKYMLVVTNRIAGIEHKINYSRLKLGVIDLAKKYPNHIVSILNEGTDAEVGDAFLQCCLLGDIYYG
tara:strand:+ start:190 stop:594 length:405 start_codon:yes stop_codon:yes gene_type:complete